MGWDLFVVIGSYFNVFMLGAILALTFWQRRQQKRDLKQIEEMADRSRRSIESLLHSHGVETIELPDTGEDVH